MKKKSEKILQGVVCKKNSPFQAHVHRILIVSDEVVENFWPKRRPKNMASLTRDAT